jgi:hypothetical protein
MINTAQNTPASAEKTKRASIKNLEPARRDLAAACRTRSEKLAARSTQLGVTARDIHNGIAGPDVIELIVGEPGS